MVDSKETIIKSALKYLVKMQIEEGSVGFAVDNDHDHDCCWDDVFAWLEAQPCEDCISRQDAIDFIIDNYGVGFTSLTNGIRDYLPSVTPQRPKGKWIEVFVETPNDPYSYGFKSHKCSKCECRPLQISNYCPNCGAEMNGGGEDGEDSACD